MLDRRITDGMSARSSRIEGNSLSGAERNMGVILKIYYPMEEITRDFNEYSTKHPAFLAVFTADWCTGCKALKPVLEVLRDDGVPILEIDVDIEKNADLANSFSVMSLPTVMGIVDGQIVGMPIIGAAGKGKLTELWEVIREGE